MVGLKNRTIKQIAPALEVYAGTERGYRILRSANSRLSQLIDQNAGMPRAMKVHTKNEIFPCISLYEAMQENGIPKEAALEFLDTHWSRMAGKKANQIKLLLKLGHIYRLYPLLFQMMAKKCFGTKAGFRARFYERGKLRCKFDMEKCLFLDTCKTYGCPELTQCFCHTDDINNEHLHPCLIWNRTCFMGKGDDFCDFDIYVEESGTERL